MSAILNPVPSPHQPMRQPKPVLVPEPEEQGGRPAWTMWAAIVILAALGIGSWRWYSTKQQTEALAALPATRTAKAVVAPLQNKIRLAGVTTARNFLNVMVPKLTGPEGNRPMTVLKLAPNGSFVKKGQVVMEIDGQALQDHIDDVHATVEQAEGDVEKRKAEQALDLENLVQNVRVAKSELDKVELESKAKELRTSLDQELIQLSVEEAQAKYNQLLKEVDLKKQLQASEMAILGYTTNRHTRHRDRHKMDLKKFLVYANMDGLAVVQNVFRGSEFDTIKVGDVVMPGQTALKIVDPKSMQVEGNINQAEASVFRIGEPALISVDAFPGMTFSGKLYSVGALAVAGGRAQNFIRTIPVKVALEGYDPRLIPDLSASADILTETVEEKALVIPRGALHFEDGKSYVYAKEGSSFTKREVTTGGMNETQISVKTGLSAGDEVALNYSVPVAQQVAAR